MLGCFDEGDSDDNAYVRIHRRNSSPVLREYFFVIHRGDQAINTESPAISQAAWNDFRELVVGSASDSAVNAWAAGIGGIFDIWWNANIEPSGSRWISQLRDLVEVGAVDVP